MADTAGPGQDDLRRCFICLMDENETGSSDSAWVTPCPCTLEGHQDCMIEWVTELERENKEIRCPVCKAPIHVDEPYDPALALNNTIYKTFSKISPGLILGGLGAGTWVGLAMYGNIAVRVFAGPEATYRFFFNDRNPRGVPNVNWIHVAALPTIAPALVIGQSFPVLGNVFFMPAAALYGVFHMARNDNFFSWPPSPQLAAAAFPYIRAAYNNLWHEFACPYLRKWDRKIAGLPEPEPPAANRRDRNQARRDRPQPGANDQNRNVGFVGGLLDAAIDMLDIPDVEVEFEVAVEEEEIDRIDEEQAAALARMQALIDETDAEAAQQADRRQERQERQERHERHQERRRARRAARAQGEAGEQPLQGDDWQPAVQEPAAQQPAAQQGAWQQPAVQQPAQVAPAPRQRGLQASLRDLTNALASTLLLPMISAGMGELIRLALPKHLTTAPGGFGRFRLKTGLLQDQWGRNLVGGCLYIVLRDAFKLYTKYRMAQNKPMRRIRNIDRRRGNASS
ncbi:hypothetical protein CPLU01_08404 [Colletotrichum plurivorum]|uniref:E3 ubiquitin-protein ligase MARCH5 n=1 Tax=Colletotrichum plurivorum TaxID=2175906 RepID=A0A8H6NDI6_9PEZI|nr:hypothetical protein CPLU01_08404 [Colletotrichum plurivorum]